MSFVGFVVPETARRIVWKIQVWRPLTKKSSHFSSASYVAWEHKGQWHLVIEISYLMWSIFIFSSPQTIKNNSLECFCISRRVVFRMSSPLVIDQSPYIGVPLLNHPDFSSPRHLAGWQALTVLHSFPPFPLFLSSCWCCFFVHPSSKHSADWEVFWSLEHQGCHSLPWSQLVPGVPAVIWPWGGSERCLNFCCKLRARAPRLISLRCHILERVITVPGPAEGRQQRFSPASLSAPTTHL